MGQVEMPHPLLARIGRSCAAGGGVGEGIGNRQPALLNQILPGLQVPPEIRVRRLRGEQPKKAERSEREGGDLQPVGRHGRLDSVYRLHTPRSCPAEIKVVDKETIAKYIVV